jgi:NitT/TauT family transport system substrate-binding protein
MKKDIQNLKRREFINLSALIVGGSILQACGNQTATPTPTSTSTSTAKTEKKLDKIRFALGWKAQAEYGGFYQAVATGIYQDYDLNVEIQPTGPQSNVTQLLLGGVVDLTMGHAVNAIKNLESGIPTITVAAIFQKEVQVLLSHPNVGNDSLAQLKNKPIFLSPSADQSYWPVLKTKYGFTDEQKRPYNFNVSPFLVDKNSAQQGIMTSEPYTIEQKGGFKPNILSLAEANYNPYTFTIETTKKLVQTNPELVQRFVDASIKGWYSYLKNPAPGNELIKKDNPEMTDELISFGLNKLKEYSIVASGDAEKLGIGAMNNARWESLFKELVQVGILKNTTDYKQAYTLDFVNKGLDYYIKG